MKLEGWRGVITIQEQEGTKIATKSAKEENKKGAINKESQLITYLNNKHIDFVPQLIQSGDGRFSYPRIEGEHFKDIYNQADLSMKKKLVLGLLDKAYQLDTAGIIHGELIRPFTNILVNQAGKIYIIDFERGSIGDTSGKNMRSYSQWLLAEGRIDLETTKSLGSMDKDGIYKMLIYEISNHRDMSQAHPENYNTQRNHSRPGSTKSKSLQIFRGAVIIALLIGLDQVTKYLFYDLERGAEHVFLTPILNTGIGRSIPIPLPFVIGATICICGGVIRGRVKKHISSWVSVLILAGAGGNLIDRVFLGGVRDFVDFQVRPIFNFADVYLSIAVVLLLLTTWNIRQ